MSPGILKSNFSCNHACPKNKSKMRGKFILFLFICFGSGDNFTAADFATRYKLSLLPGE